MCACKLEGVGVFLLDEGEMVLVVGEGGFVVA